MQDAAQTESILGWCPDLIKHALKGTQWMPIVAPSVLETQGGYTLKKYTLILSTHRLTVHNEAAADWLWDILVQISVSIYVIYST